jgi:hypothetical protein
MYRTYDRATEAGPGQSHSAHQGRDSRIPRFDDGEVGGLIAYREGRHVWVRPSEGTATLM